MCIRDSLQELCADIVADHASAYPACCLASLPAHSQDRIIARWSQSTKGSMCPLTPQQVRLFHSSDQLEHLALPRLPSATLGAMLFALSRPAFPRLTTLDISGAAGSASALSELSAPSLTSLDVGGCSLPGAAVLQCLARHPNLRMLNLRDAGIRLHPSSFCPGLTDLNISGNLITDQAAVGILERCAFLVKLQLSCTDVSSAIGHALASRQLCELDLSLTQFGATGLAQVCDPASACFETLSSLRLSGSPAACSLSPALGLPALTCLHAAHSDLSQLPLQLSHFSTLRELDLSQSSVSGILPLPASLRALNLANTPATDVTCESLAQSTLSSLDLSNTAVSTEGLAMLLGPDSALWARLTQIAVRNNACVTDQTVTLLASMPRVRVVDLCGCVNVRVLSMWQDTAVQTLLLRETSVDSLQMIPLRRAPMLRVLNVEGCSSEHSWGAPCTKLMKAHPLLQLTGAQGEQWALPEAGVTRGRTVSVAVQFTPEHSSPTHTPTRRAQVLKHVYSPAKLRELCAKLLAEGLLKRPDNLSNLLGCTRPTSEQSLGNSSKLNPNAAVFRWDNPSSSVKQ
eukprot:TRINITY_DN6507_c0_g2_i2.p1 TRINITY_DN6507_c0_g2~~TRINITY_DN6507_c0_g2_i2.p1  ORF type:complete len:573 (+),score=91.52 TRINITY_DN6507_c0_g2_i2:156-1874(+)